MDHIAMGAEGADLQAVLVDGIQEFLALFVVVQQNLGVAVSLAGAAAAADLNHLYTVRCQECASLIQGHTAQRHCKYA